MTALREFIKVKNHEVNIQLPNDFDYEEVEVIIIPKKEDDYEFWSDKEIENFGKYSFGLSSNDFEDDDDIEGFPFELYDTPEDMVDYITRTVSRIKL